MLPTNNFRLAGDGAAMQIETGLDRGLCRLRPLQEQDLAGLARLADNPRVAAWLRDRFPHPYTEDDARRFYEYACLAEGECVAAITSHEQVAGIIGIQFRTDIERCSAELGYWLGEPFWGKGLATEAVRVFTAWAMPRYELTRVYAEVFAGNPASGRVLEKAGFDRVGVLRKAALKRGEYHDYVLYELTA